MKRTKLRKRKAEPVEVDAMTFRQYDRWFAKELVRQKKMLCSEKVYADRIARLEAEPDCWAVIRTTNDVAAFMHYACMELARAIEFGEDRDEIRAAYEALAKAGFDWVCPDWTDKVYTRAEVMARKSVFAPATKENLMKRVDEFRRPEIMLTFLKALRPVIKRRLKRRYQRATRVVVENFVEGFVYLTAHFGRVLRMPRSRIILPVYWFDMSLFDIEGLRDWANWGSDSVLPGLAERASRTFRTFVGDGDDDEPVGLEKPGRVADRQGRTAPHYSCTDCGGNAYVGMSNWKGPGGQLIGKDERLCISCTRKRGIVWRS